MPIRSFIAIEIPGDIQEGIGTIDDRLRAADADVKWVNPSSIHLTTKFLGDVPEPHIQTICEVMKSAARHTARFGLDVGGLGTFPPKGFPRVLWVGVHGQLEPLTRLVEEVEQRLRDDLGIACENRTYHPHLTIGRVRSSRNTDRLRALMQECEPVRLGTFTAGGLTFFMSKISRDGSIYTPMAEAKFGA